MPDTYNCTLSGNMPDGTYQVLGENRTVTVKNGKLNDKFVGYMTHIYTNDLKYKSAIDIAALENEIKLADEKAKEEIKNLPAEQPRQPKKATGKKSGKAKKK